MTVPFTPPWDDSLTEQLQLEEYEKLFAPQEDDMFPAPGYERLAEVYRNAHDQAAFGKGRDRHANDLPFDEQRMQTISRTQNSPYGMAFQVQKKMLEGLEMGDYIRCRTELLGALNYLAGMVIFLDDQNSQKTS